MKLFDGCLRGRMALVRLALCVILVAIASAGLTTPVRADGGATHHEVVDRAYNAINTTAYPDLAALLTSHKPAVNGGAVFPDCCYNMPADSQFWRHVSDDAHTTQFQTAYLNIVRSAFRQHSSNEVDLKTITFLFGVIAHNEADNPWHFPGFDHGTGLKPFLIAALEADPDDNHTAVELGADIFVNVEDQYAQGGYEPTWDFPVDTVRATYLALGHDVPALGLLQGWDMVAVFHEVEKGMGAAYWPNRIDLVWTHDYLESYSVGGINDAKGHSAAAWQDAWDELGTYRSFLPTTYNKMSDAGSGSPAPAILTTRGGQQTSDEVRQLDEQYNARTMLFARVLLDEGAVKVHSQLKNGIYTIERVEIVDQQRVDELARLMFGVSYGQSSR